MLEPNVNRLIEADRLHLLSGLKMFNKTNLKQVKQLPGNNSSSSAYLYLHSLIQRSVHESVERQEKSANGVEKSVPILAVPVESENKAKH